ncbi:MAG TPA: type VI secretion system-associated FHA domain protein TagH [Steroidobacteraceae bacterium]|nr:type VI secretion system-associated FHA domain protein TagH [Steroidobacteraceae bacterium]
MPLTLEVVGPKAAKMGAAVRKVFQAAGTIGRQRDNDWVLPDEYISGHHAKILFVNGNFMIEDTSTNGVFINSPQNRLARGQPYTLRNGDTVYIDDYEVRVTLSTEGDLYGAAKAPLIPDDPFQVDSAESAGAPNEADPLKLLGLEDPRAVPPGPSAASLASQSPLSQHYRPPPASMPRAVPAPSPSQRAVPPRAAPPPPPAVPPRAQPPPPSRNIIPDDYDPLGADEPSVRMARPAPQASVGAVMPPPADTTPVGPSQLPLQAPPSEPPRRPAARAPEPAVAPARAPPVTPRPAPPRADAPRVAPGRPAAAPARRSPAEGSAGDAEPQAAGAASGDLDFAELLAGAGIDSARVTPELAQQFGQILRVVVAGVMDVLRARERTKDEFRMRMTTFKPMDNNPLKFSANVEDALHNLLVKRNAAYLGPVEAFEDALQDVRNHQMAMLAGVRVAYEAMLTEFDPARLQEEFDRQLKSGSFLSGPAKLKYWEMYRNKFHDMVKDADTSFRSLFGDEFAKAYEEQLARLKTLNRAERR